MIFDEAAFQKALSEYDAANIQPDKTFDYQKEQTEINEKYYTKTISLLEKAIQAQEKKLCQS